MVKLEVSEELFPGFYNSYLFDDEDEEEFTDEEHTERENEICERVVGIIKEHYKVVEWKLIRPKEYNYKNDKIVVTIDASLEDFLIDYIKDKEGIYKYVMEWNYKDYFDHYLCDAFMESMMYCTTFGLMDIKLSDNLEEYLKYGYDYWH